MSAVLAVLASPFVIILLVALVTIATLAITHDRKY